jgi:hypothetical protein
LFFQNLSHDGKLAVNGDSVNLSYRAFVVPRKQSVAVGGREVKRRERRAPFPVAPLKCAPASASSSPASFH